MTNSRWLLALHRWTSVVSTVFLLVSCLSGLPLVFSDELAALSEGAATSAPPAAKGPVPSIDQLLRLTNEREPSRFVQFVFWPDHDLGALGLGTASRADAPLDDVQREIIDTRTGDKLSERPAEGGPLNAVLTLHKNLFLGRAGDALYAAVAVLFLLSTVSGALIYGPFMKTLDFGTIRRHSSKLQWLDLHNLVGIATLGWALIVGATGFLNTLESALFSAWQNDRLATLLSAHEHESPVAHPSSIDAALATARSALPGLEPSSIGLFGTRYGTPHHNLVWMHGTTKLQRRFFTPVLIDAETGALSTAEPLPWYLRALEVSRPLHFGDYGGLPLKLIWAGLDLCAVFVLLSGLRLWSLKWGAPKRGERQS